ncbi:unnamed protein product, partial [Ectocarpus sp. 12 AP-2014]
KSSLLHVPHPREAVSALAPAEVLAEPLWDERLPAVVADVRVVLVLGGDPTAVRAPDDLAWPGLGSRMLLPRPGRRCGRGPPHCLLSGDLLAPCSRSHGDADGLARALPRRGHRDRHSRLLLLRVGRGPGARYLAHGLR